jgi:sugar lactone lactonase YvrE
MTLDRKGNLFICYLNKNFVYKYNPSGKLITELIPEDANQWRFNHPSDMAVDIKGNVYVADFSNYFIQKYSPVTDNKKFSGYSYICRFFK